MPSLDDLGTKQMISGTPDPEDLIPFFDLSEFGNDKVKKTTVSALLAGAGGGSTDTITTSNGTAAAGAGKIGEYLSNEGSASLTNYTAATVATLTLTPGEWDVEGLFYLDPDAASISLCSSGISTTAGSPSGFPNIRQDYLRTTGDSDAHYIIPPKRRFLVATSTTIRLVVVVSFSAGTVSASGHLRARRVR